jgi:hypothetical protein
LRLNREGSTVDEKSKDEAHEEGAPQVPASEFFRSFATGTQDKAEFVPHGGKLSTERLEDPIIDGVGGYSFKVFDFPIVKKLAVHVVVELLIRFLLLNQVLLILTLFHYKITLYLYL